MKTAVPLVPALLLSVVFCLSSGSAADFARVEESPPEELKGLPPIVFARFTNENWDIWRVNPDGSDLARLTTDPARDIYPKWSPDGRQIVFQSDRGAAPMPESFEKWRWLREDIGASTHDKEYGIYVMDADGQNAKKVWQGGKTPAFSHDGKAIVFSFNGRIWVKRLDAQDEPWPITPEDWWWAALPDWRSDGRQIVCVAKIKKAPAPIVIEMDPATYKPVSPAGRDKAWSTIYPAESYEWHGCNPEYSADGGLITHTFDAGGSLICIVGVDGKTPPRRKFQPLKGWNHCGDLSPDGKHVAFANAPGGEHPSRSDTALRLWVCDVACKSAFQVVKGDGMCRDPDWSHAPAAAGQH